MPTSELTNQMCANTNALMGFAMSFTHDPEDANDLLQDTMIKALKYADHFIAGTNLKAWMFTIMRNTFINDYRRKAKKQKLMSTTEDFSNVDLLHSAAGNQGEGKFQMADIQKALAKLKPELAIPFVRYFEGYKYTEIAEELQIPIGTVKTRIFGARQILMANLKMYHEEYKRLSA